jgi:hypothetical protein
MSKIKNKAELRGTKYTSGELGVGGGRGWFIGMLVFLSTPHLIYRQTAFLVWSSWNESHCQGLHWQLTENQLILVGCNVNGMNPVFNQIDLPFVILFGF